VKFGTLDLHITLNTGEFHEKLALGRPYFCYGLYEITFACVPWKLMIP
jgi:hypothetical protein